MDFKFTKNTYYRSWINFSMIGLLIVLANILFSKNYDSCNQICLWLSIEISANIFLIVLFFIIGALYPYIYKKIKKFIKILLFYFIWY